MAEEKKRMLRVSERDWIARDCVTAVQVDDQGVWVRGPNYTLNRVTLPKGTTEQQLAYWLEELG